jgi:hypothetical protein
MATQGSGALEEELGTVGSAMAPVSPAPQLDVPAAEETGQPEGEPAMVLAVPVRPL